MRSRLPSRRLAVLVFFVVTGVPIALLAYLSISIPTASAVGQAEKAAMDSAQASAVFIHQNFQEVAEQIDSFGATVLAPSLAGGPGRYDLRGVSAALDQLRNARIGITAAFVTDLRGQLVAIAPGRADLVGRYFTGDDWYLGVTMGHSPFVAGLSASAADQDVSSVAIAAAVHGPPGVDGAGGAGPPEGYLVGIYSLAQVQAFVTDFQRTRGSRLSVVDGGGMVLAAPGLAPGSVSSWTGDPSMLRTALAGHPVVTQHGAGPAAFLSAAAPVPGFGWAVIAETPAAVALRDANQLRATVLVIAGVLVLVLTAGLVVGLALVQRAQQSAVFQQRMEALGRLNEAARSVHAEQGLRALQVITTSARELVEADLSALGVRDAERGGLELVAHDASAALSPATALDLALRIAGGVPAGPAEAAPDLGPSLSVQLAAGERVLGCLAVARVAGSPAFDQVQEGQLAQISQHATAVLENSRHEAERDAFLQRLSETNRELERANQAKSRFLATVSHELRTPLSAIIGFSDLLLEGGSGELRPSQEEDVRQISQAGRVLLDVIDDLLDLSRIEAGRMRLEPQPMLLGPLLRDVAAALRPLAAERHVELKVVTASPDMPVLADALRMRQVVTNLVSNAIKFTQHGRVTIGVALAGQHVEVSVEDTGIGIPEEALSTLFDEFSQVGGARQPGSTGLGLSIVRRLVQLQGGDVGVQSRLGAGTRLWLRLPRAEVGLLTARPSPREAAG